MNLFVFLGLTFGRVYPSKNHSCLHRL